MPPRLLTPAAEASFVAYVHYLEDLAGVIAGAYGRGIDGVHQTMALHPPVRALAPRTLSAAEVAALNAHAQQVWQRLTAIDNAVTSDARVAMLLRTTRQRIIEREFALARRTDVRPGRTRRNLTREHKELIAARVPPTTVFDVFDRLRRRVQTDDGEAFVDAPFDEVEALRLGEALAFVADASVAVVEALTAQVVGAELSTDLLRSHLRRVPSSSAAQRRERATNRS
jgi:hypothetical protein